MTDDPALSPPNPLKVSLHPCPGCGHRRVVLVRGGLARFRTHDRRPPSRDMNELAKPKVDRCPGSRTPVELWAAL